MGESGDDEASVPNYEKYRSAVEALERTHEEELRLHENLTQKAIDVVKVDLLSLSLLATGISLAPAEFSLSLLPVASVVSFVYAIWAAVQVFDPTSYPRGIDSEGGVQIDRHIQDDVDAEGYYRRLLYSYISATEEFDDRYDAEREYFTRSVWFTYAGVLFVTVSALNVAYLNLPVWGEVPQLICVVVLVTWGSDIPSEVEP